MGKNSRLVFYIDCVPPPENRTAKIRVASLSYFDLLLFFFLKYLKIQFESKTFLHLSLSKDLVATL